MVWKSSWMTGFDYKLSRTNFINYRTARDCHERIQVPKSGKTFKNTPKWCSRALDVYDLSTCLLNSLWKIHSEYTVFYIHFLRIWRFTQYSLFYCMHVWKLNISVVRRFSTLYTNTGRQKLKTENYQKR